MSSKKTLEQGILSSAVGAETGRPLSRAHMCLGMKELF